MDNSNDFQVLKNVLLGEQSEPHIDEFSECMYVDLSVSLTQLYFMRLTTLYNIREFTSTVNNLYNAGIGSLAPNVLHFSSNNIICIVKCH